jgi:hypothetical protein
MTIEEYFRIIFITCAYESHIIFFFLLYLHKYSNSQIVEDQICLCWHVVLRILHNHVSPMAHCHKIPKLTWKKGTCNMKVSHFLKEARMEAHLLLQSYYSLPPGEINKIRPVIYFVLL